MYNKYVGLIWQNSIQRHNIEAWINGELCYVYKVANLTLQRRKFYLEVGEDF